MKYSEQAQQLWQDYVPDDGQANTVQGELLRVVEKLRDEARRNGNLNWDDNFELMLSFLSDTLKAQNTGDVQSNQAIANALSRLEDYQEPCTDNITYDTLADACVEWCQNHPEPIERKFDPSLLR
jgi:hypothetical protein